MKSMAILVGGGPAPGINSVIGAASIRARLAGVEVIGIRDGFQWIMQGDVNQVVPLTIEDVSRIHFSGGSVLGTSRANPTRDPRYVEAALEALKRLNVGQLVTIGGDDTAFSAMALAKHAEGRLNVVHVPKTIDNDLDLPESIPTFGYQTARHAGVGLVKALLTDAYTTSRWYLVVAMGRKAGHLALGIGKAAGATVTIIPEEFTSGTISVRNVVDILTGSIIKRLSYGRADGVAVLAEGLVERMAEDEIAAAGNVEYDAHGHLRIAEINFGDLLKRGVLARLRELGLKSTVVSKNIGYELRCTDPIPFDMEYTRDLGYCASKYLLEGGTGAMITIQRGVFKPVPFTDMLDPDTGRTRVRMVDINTEHYRIARRYMLRLRRDDFADDHELAKFAAAAGLTLEQFREQFEYLVKDEPPPIRFVV
ncbi:MAG: 6-phosphofructokinase [Proteobacteria bacterium]|nr:6-phosphofructokinase [Pseudomonadota bacterium]